MSRRKRITPAVLRSKPPASGRVEVRDSESPLIVMVTSTGARSYIVRPRIRGGWRRPDGNLCHDPVRLTFPDPPFAGDEGEAQSNIGAAREWAVQMVSMCRRGIDPRAEARAKAASEEADREQDERSRFEVVAQAWLDTNGAFKKGARPWKPRTRAEYDRIVKSRLIPQWRGRRIHSITRDEIADFAAGLAETLPVAANRALATLSALMGWYQAQRGSAFTSPVVRGMAPSEETARDRILSDDELRTVWRVAERSGTYGAMVRMLLLTGARKGEVAAMRHSHIGKDGIWSLPGERTKNHEALHLPLSQSALSIIAEQPRVILQTDPEVLSDIVFTLDGEHEFQNWGHAKAEFDARCLRRLRAAARLAGKDVDDVKALPNWRLHDLRRTARSLMSRARVRPDHAERVLNHKIGGVEGTYDRHSYEDEKRQALQALAAQLTVILRPPEENVVRLTRGAAE